MGGDFGPRFCVPASLRILENYPTISLTLIGDTQQIQSLLPVDYKVERLSIVHSGNVVSMSDRPGYALRHKQQSSMWRAIELVANDGADACVSAGNTGALMAMGRHLIKPISGIHRPAICKPMPASNQVSYMLDLGANIQCSSEHLYQFALMGAAIARLNGAQHPKIALLNVGSESTKGGGDIHAAAERIERDADLDFIGYLEGDEIFGGRADVIVCDGFSGNVALKVSEGVAKYAIQSLRHEASSSFVKRFFSPVIGMLLRSWWHKYNPSLFNGAALLGLRKTVIKSHGGADQLGFYKAIEAAIEQVEANIAVRIEKSLLAI